MLMERHGAQSHAGAAAECIDGLEAVVHDQQAGRAGIRLHGLAGLGEPLAAGGAVGLIAATHLRDCRPVRAILFDKSEMSNWALGWHQDRTIAVAERIDVDGFGPWTSKQGLLHVEPPFVLIAGMVTLRVHLDPVDEDNAPLLVAPGSHLLGRIAEGNIPAAVASCGSAACLAERGDVWAYATPILHASARATRPRRRRVLQIDYAAGDLPGGLEWLGI
jgi:hypothetical protein